MFTRHGHEDDIFVIELTRCSDQRAFKHFAFVYRVASCQVIRRQEASHALSEVAVDEAAEIVRDVDDMVAQSQGKSSPKPFVVYIRPDQTVSRVHWMTECDTETKPTSASWVNQIPPGTNILERHVRNGFFLGTDGFFSPRVPPVYNAWGCMLPVYAMEGTALGGQDNPRPRIGSGVRELEAAA
jgi:hypothetical protein